MAALTGQTIASSYEQLLHCDADGGLTTSLQAIKDGDNGITSALKLARDKVEVLPSGADSATAFEVSQNDGTAILTVNSSSPTVTITGDGVVTDDLTLNSDASVLTFGAGSDVTFTHDNGTGMNVASAGDFDIAVSAGNGTFTVADGQTLTLGQSGASAILLSPHGTAGSELASLINTAGTTDGSDAAGSILLSAVAGGMSFAWNDAKDLWAEGGRAVVTANEDAADCIKLHADDGTSQTITVVNDAGTSVTEGSAAVQLLSTAGGVGVRSAANLAKAVNITSDGGTTGSIAIFNDQGTSVTEGAESISILSDAGGVGLRSTANLANAINLTVDGGTTSTMTLFNDQGTSVTEGAESIALLSDAGGVGIRSTADLANAVNITVDGGTSSTMTLFNDQGTSATEGAASIQLLSDVGGINVKSGLDGANAILLTADGGTSETIKLHADQGTGAASLNLLSDAGGITLSAGNTSHGVIVGDISGAPVTIGHTTSETTVNDNLTVAGNLSVTGTGAGATSINGLSDCLIEDNSIYMGNDPSGTTSSAERNIAVGTTALDAVTSGDNNVCIGYDAGTNITRAYNTVCIGAYAGDAIDTVGDDARDNTCIGHDAGKAFDRWGGTFVGHESGHDQRDGHTCTYIGYGTSASSNNEDVETVIGGNAPGQGANCMSLGATSIGTLYSQNTSITGYSSDERTKENVEDLDMKGLEFINELKMKKFNWINPADYPDDIRDRRYDEGHEHQIPRPDDNTKKDIGMIAQDVIETMESLDMDMQEQFSPTKKPAWGSSDNVRTLTYGNFIYPLIKAVQELSAKNEELSAKVEALENE